MQQPHWHPSGLLPTLLRADCGGQVGECLFECAAHWLWATSGEQDGARRPSSLEMRVRAAEQLRVEALRQTDEDISLAEGLPPCATLEDLRARIVSARVWGCHSLLLALLESMSASKGAAVGALVAYRADAEPHKSWEPLPPGGRVPEICMVLYHDQTKNHYNLLGDQNKNLVYCTASRCFLSSPT